MSEKERYQNLMLEIAKGARDSANQILAMLTATIKRVEKQEEEVKDLREKVDLLSTEIKTDKSFLRGIWTAVKGSWKFICTIAIIAAFLISNTDKVVSFIKTLIWPN